MSEQLYSDALEMLKKLISTQSFSGEEEETGDILEEFFREKKISANRYLNNVWAKNKFFEAAKPTLLLNSHHDTVRPNSDWTRNPFSPGAEEGKLFGLGSNDAGGALVSLIAAFVHFYEKENLPFNLIIAATAEEETAGKGGIESLLQLLPEIDAAIVGEPTQMQMAIAEKGLLVLDCTAHGKSGHAARNIGVNAIAKAMNDINWFHSFQFPKISQVLGPVKMTVTQIQAGTQHNVIPDRCTFVVDVRVTDEYSHEEALEIIRKNVECDVQPRSMRLRPSKISSDHPIVLAAKEKNIPLFGSPTMSDQALIPVPSVKIGPGMSERSHTADEFIFLDEIREGIKIYISLLEKISFPVSSEKIL